MNVPCELYNLNRLLDRIGCASFDSWHVHDTFAVESNTAKDQHNVKKRYGQMTHDLYRVEWPLFTLSRSKWRKSLAGKVTDGFSSVVSKTCFMLPSVSSSGQSNALELSFDKSKHSHTPLAPGLDWFSLIFSSWNTNTMLSTHRDLNRNKAFLVAEISKKNPW